MRSVVCSAAVILCLTGASAAEGPRSAIPWLSESLKTAPRDGVGPRSTAPTVTAPDEGISVTSLDAPPKDGVGLLTPQQTGLPADLWGPTSALRVRALVLSQDADGVPEAQALLQRILLADTKPPLGSGNRPFALTARIDRLMDLGALDQAEALLKLAGLDDPAMFRRAFDVGLLTERTDDVCKTLRDSPALSPTLPARVFCLARLGDWTAAELTLSLGKELGDIDQMEEAVLSRFLDPQLFEDLEAPPPPDPLTPLDFVLRDAVALPRPSGPLPMAFLHIDVAEHAPMRARIEAGERLVRAGVIAPTTLFEAYRAGKPAASGGIWDRAALVQKLDKAFDDGSPERIAMQLAMADDAFSDQDLRLAFARAYSGRLAALSRDGFPDRQIDRPHNLLLLAGDVQTAQKWRRVSPTVHDRLLEALADAGRPLPDGATLSDIEQTMIRALTRLDPPSTEGEQLADMIDKGRVGEAILRALDLLQDGFEVDPGDLETALFALRAAGQEPSARRIALEKLLLRPEA